MSRELITSYAVYYYAGGETASPGYRAVIVLRTLQKRVIGAIFFLRTPDFSDTDNIGGDPIYVQCYFPPEAFPQILDLLRNEAPVYLDYNESTNRARIVTSDEPIGEGEWRHA